jgi:hypothetical protein
MRHPLLLLSLMMCGGLAVASGQNRYGGDPAVPEAVTPWRANPFLTTEPKLILHPANYSASNLPGPRQATGHSLRVQEALHLSGGGTRSGHPGRYPWKLGIVTTIFWVGERPTTRNPVPNRTSAWDKHWSANYGGYDNPEPSARRHYVPVRFVPRQNPFYVALPYNDVEGHHTKREAAWVIPWFKEAFVRDGQTILKDRWVAIRHGDRVCYAQWEDCGPFRTDHWQYVFGNERPRPNLNQGAGLDVSPAVRDYLGLAPTKDVCDWKFVEFAEVPSGPWLFYGQNHRFALSGR